jgi:hypothetical protein
MMEKFAEKSKAPRLQGAMCHNVPLDYSIFAKVEDIGLIDWTKRTTWTTWSIWSFL